MKIKNRYSQSLNVVRKGIPQLATMIREGMQPIVDGVNSLQGLSWLGYLCPTDPYYNYFKKWIA